ncbi:hypothetical protein [Dysgonomonas capnocytophagoides]|uniref:hypothetical protein n=1 Tax=Dysgonomonas capnocytophagoides TaxID=45254 RepID=UPI00291F547D|nr:hypothetical protein DCPSUM001_33610 [Dysgonomonas capnocytophagoides]
MVKITFILSDEIKIEASIISNLDHLNKKVAIAAQNNPDGSITFQNDEVGSLIHIPFRYFNEYLWFATEE